MLSKLVLILPILFLSACATVEQPSSNNLSPTAASLAKPQGINHVVQKGETLWRISKMYRIDIDEIVRTNRISDSTSISSGQVLIIPRSKTTTAPIETNFATQDNADFNWPAKGKILTHFKERSNGVLSKGIDIETEANQDILACRDGKITFVGNIAGYGETIIIDHQDGLSSVYCGNSNVAVKTGDLVKQGTLIAKAGHTPRKDNDSIHFEIRKRHKPQNPLYYLN